MSLRGVSLATRFIFIIYLTRHLPVSDIGVYGIMTATVEFFAYSMGLEFHSFSGRELMICGSMKLPFMIRDQLVFNLLACVLIIPIYFTLSSMEVLGEAQLSWFIPLVFVEYLSQESQRMLISLSCPLLSLLVNFIRSSAWIYPLIVTVWLLQDKLILAWIWQFWFAGVTLSLLIPIIAATRLKWWHIGEVGIDWQWIRRGLRTAFLFFISSVFVRLNSFLDRNILDWLHGPEAVGIYHFFMGIANVLVLLVEAGVVAYHYPKLVIAFRQGNGEQIRSAFKSYFTVAMSATIIVAVLIGVSIYPFLVIIGRDEYRQQLGVFWWLLGAMILWCLSFIPHYALYAMGKDLALMVVSGVQITVFFVVALGLGQFYYVTGLAMAQLIAIAISLVMKSIWTFYAGAGKFYAK